MIRLVVLVSGNGSNLGAVLDACESGTLDAEVVAVVSNQPDAYGLVRASKARVPSKVVEQLGDSRSTYDARLAMVVARYQPDLVVLAGWMRILTGTFLDHFAVLNLHPAKPSEFPGTHAIERAFREWQAGEITESGVMVHWVPDEGVDTGPTIAWRTVVFRPGDTLDSFQERIRTTEHALLVEAIHLAGTQIGVAP